MPTGFEWTNGLTQIILWTISYPFTKLRWQNYSFLLCYKFHYFNNLNSHINKQKYLFVIYGRFRIYILLAWFFILDVGLDQILKELAARKSNPRIKFAGWVRKMTNQTRSCIAKSLTAKLHGFTGSESYKHVNSIK